jgi:hypothetical protein
MSAARLLVRSVRPSMAFTRPFSITSHRMASPGNAKGHEDGSHRKLQTEKPLNPHMTNTSSTIANEMPSVGARKAPPEFLSAIDPDFVPKDSVPENTERMTGGTQKGAPEDGVNAEMGVGQMEGASFKVEPLRRTGEDSNTMRARLLCSHYAFSVFKSIAIADVFGSQIKVVREVLSRVISYYRLSQKHISEK